LQEWCVTHRALLAERGVWYPPTTAGQDKHQFLVQALIDGRLDEVAHVLDEARGVTVLMSAEGLSNHLDNFSASALAGLRELTESYETTVFAAVRPREPWLRSIYAQMVINPPNERMHYATPLAYEEFQTLERIQRLASLPMRGSDLATAFGAVEVRLGAYPGGWWTTFLDLLGLDDAPPLQQSNSSASPALVELIRQVNALGLSPTKRALALAALEHCFATGNLVLRDLARQHPIPVVTAFTATLVGRLVANDDEQREALDRFVAWLAVASDG